MMNNRGDSNESTLDIASMNNRSNKPAARKLGQQNLSGTKQERRLSLIENPLQRADFGYPVSSNRHEDLLVRKGKVDFADNKNQANRIIPDRKLNQMQNLVHSALQQPKLTMFERNCITRSIPQAGVCEDHLIKRLDQDATEGRTVIDVERRVCCALFWHKECIDRVILEVCPDSTPVAADFVFGERKIDLTTSCLRFNREGCNGSTRMNTDLINSLPIIVTITMILLYL